MFIERDVYKRLEKELKRKQITAIVGARQVGKTTLMKKLMEDINEEKIYLSFENIKILALFDNDVDLFISTYIKPYKYIFIDEFQYSKNGGKNLKYIYDMNPGKKIFISGSSYSELSINSIQYLVGRVNIITIYPLTFAEFVKYKYKDYYNLLLNKNSEESFGLLKDLFFEYITFGGYPEVVIEKDYELKKDLLRDIMNTYLLKEIKDILDFKNLFEFENLITRLALQDGSILNKSNIAQDLDINRNKISEMLSVLEKTYILSVVRPYLRNKIREQIKSPKIYFNDLGLKNAVINNFNVPKIRDDKGSIYENFVLSQLIRKDIKLSYFNINKRYEIDFVVEYGGFRYGIEVKSKLKDNVILKSINKFRNLFKVKKIFVLNKEVMDVRKVEDVEVVYTYYTDIFNIISEIKKS